MHKGTNKILPNIFPWAHLKSKWFQEIYLRSFHCCADFGWNRGIVASAFGKLVAGTQTILHAASMGPISSMAQERTWFFNCSFWQIGSFADFYFWAAGFFSRNLSPVLLFLLISVDKVPRKIFPEYPQQNPPKFIQQTSPTHFCRGASSQSSLWTNDRRKRDVHKISCPESERV